ncbi:MAG: DUF1579 family protein [Planctomycetota bacterium]|jgi:hypothetical protein
MKINRNIAGLLAVAAAAYVAGRFDLLTGGGTGAWAQDDPEPSDAEMVYLEVGTPGPNHEILDQMVGEWDGLFKIWMAPDAPPMTSRGTVTREWVLGGRYLKEVVKATSDMGTFEGLGYIGYNNFDGQYQTVWMDSMSTGIFMETGTYHPDKKVLHTAGDHRDPVTGRVVHSWGKTDMSKPDRHTYTGYSTDADGRTYTAFEGVSERRNPTKK